MEQIKNTWGGHREGSGRKATGRQKKPRAITATDEEWDLIKEMARQNGMDISAFVVNTLLKR